MTAGEPCYYARASAEVASGSYGAATENHGESSRLATRFCLLTLQLAANYSVLTRERRAIQHI